MLRFYCKTPPACTSTRRALLLLVAFHASAPAALLRCLPPAAFSFYAPALAHALALLSRSVLPAAPGSTARQHPLRWHRAHALCATAHSYHAFRCRRIAAAGAHHRLRRRALCATRCLDGCPYKRLRTGAAQKNAPPALRRWHYADASRLTMLLVLCYRFVARSMPSRAHSLTAAYRATLARATQTRYRRALRSRTSRACAPCALKRITRLRINAFGRSACAAPARRYQYLPALITTTPGSRWLLRTLLRCCIA